MSDPILEAMHQRLQDIEAERRKVKAAIRAYHGEAANLPKGHGGVSVRPGEQSKIVRRRGDQSLEALVSKALVERSPMSVERIESVVKSQRDLSNANSIRNTLSRLKAAGRAVQGDDGRWSIVKKEAS